MQDRTRKPRWNNETNERRAAEGRRFDSVARRALIAALFAGAVGGGTLRAQSIINETSGFNNRFEGFSSVSAEKIALLDGAAAKKAPAPSGSLSEANKVELELPAPKGAPRENVGSSCRVPFSFPQGSDAATATAVELFCSPDMGATWRVYAGVRPEDGVDAFVFQAPKPGVYWFALKTSFANGESAFSSTRAYRFVEPASAAPPAAAPEAETFALDDEAEDDAAPLGTPTAPVSENASGERANKLLDLAGGASKADAPKKNGASEVDAARPATGKIKSLGPAKEKGTDRLVLVLRWYRPSELEEARRGRPATIAVERAADPNGPWTRIADSLSSEREWFSWFAGADETKPFYVRTVATDDEGNEWIDATPQPLDLSTKWVRSALGRVVWPGSTDDEEEKESNDVDEKADSNAASGSKASVGGLIRNASSVDSVDVDEADDGEEEKESSASDGSKRSLSKKAKKNDATERAQTTSVSPRRPRPNVPAPTNPNEFSLNPLFTQGFGVLFQAAQTRRGDGESDSKRSIFTPPHRAPAASRVAPAEYANAASSAARRKAATQAQDMSRFEKNPEAMEGMIFYQDENGELTTTPPKDFATAGVDASFGGSFDGSFGGAFPGGATTIGTGPNGEPTVLPGDNETYDANPNSGAASLTNGMYPNAATPGNSPLNNRYGTPPIAAPGAAYTPSAFPSGAYQTIPETSFGPSVGRRAVPSNAPVYAPTPRGNAGPALFPPRPSVSR